MAQDVCESVGRFAGRLRLLPDAGAEITQVSDRFHLVKGLTEAAKAALEQAVPANIGLSKEGAEANCGYWDKEAKDTLAEREHQKTLKKKAEAVENVRELHAKGAFQKPPPKLLVTTSRPWSHS